MHKRYTETEKDQIIYKIVCGELFLEEASKKYNVSTVSLVKWLKERKGLVDRYFGNAEQS